MDKVHFGGRCPKYDRNLVDVFYIKNESDEDKVIKEGLFLNNELLVGNYAVRM